QKKIGMCPREAHIAASDCFQLCRGRIALANMCLHCGPKPHEANRGEIAQQAHDISEVIFWSRVRHARLAGSCAQRQSPNTVALQDTLSCPKRGLSHRAVMIGRCAFGRGPLLDCPKSFATRGSFARGHRCSYHMLTMSIFA